MQSLVLTKILTLILNSKCHLNCWRNQKTAKIANDEDLRQHQRILRSEITRQVKRGEEVGVVLQTKHKNLKNYRETLKKLLAGHYMITKGNGLSRHQYKMGKDGKYGNLQTDVPQLVEK